MRLLGLDADFEAFQRVMIEAQRRHPIRILSYCALSNHWHFVVWPERDGQVTAFFRWLTHTHAMRWRVAHRTVGYGHVGRDEGRGRRGRESFSGLRPRSSHLGRGDCCFLT
jgi:REP element-mobilizing transposase RayT